jgi:uncharacterized membrane protein (UPF0127 family)
MTARLEPLPARELGGGLTLVQADTPLARLRGLAGLREIDARMGLELPHCRSVHTLGMRFALDLIWLDAEGAVVRVDRAVPPNRLRSCRTARAVVEVAAGHADAFLAAL